MFRSMKRSGCRIPRICETGFAGLFAFIIDLAERRQAEKHFTADLDGLRFLQVKRNRTDCAHISGNNFAGSSIAPCDGLRQNSLLVDQCDAQAIDLQLGNVLHGIQFRKLKNPRVPVHQFLGGVGVVETDHGAGELVCGEIGSSDTSDTLCYATNENQNATYALIDHGADLAIVVGGYNSSNTSHLVELCAASMPTYFVQGADDLISAGVIRHFSLARRTLETSSNWLPANRPLDIVLTCGASCPDAILDEVLKRLLGMFENVLPLDEVLSDFLPMADS